MGNPSSEDDRSSYSTVPGPQFGAGQTGNGIVAERGREYHGVPAARGDPHAHSHRRRRRRCRDAGGLCNAAAKAAFAKLLTLSGDWEGGIGTPDGPNGVGRFYLGKKGG